MLDLPLRRRKECTAQGNRSILSHRGRSEKEENIIIIIEGWLCSISHTKGGQPRAVERSRCERISEGGAAEIFEVGRQTKKASEGNDEDSQRVGLPEKSRVMACRRA